MDSEFVLVVDDDPGTRNLLAAALEAQGIRVRTAKSVLHAIESIYDGSPRPALIITDLLMPQTSGWDFLKHLRSEPALQGIPVIVVTGVEPGEGAALADLVVQKPFDPMQLAESVRSLLASGPAAGPAD
jgi:CheY-like chemotaxis protein